MSFGVPGLDHGLDAVAAAVVGIRDHHTARGPQAGEVEEHQVPSGPGKEWGKPCEGEDVGAVPASEFRVGSGTLIAAELELVDIVAEAGDPTSHIDLHLTRWRGGRSLSSW